MMDSDEAWKFSTLNTKSFPQIGEAGHYRCWDGMDIVLILFCQNRFTPEAIQKSLYLTEM